MSSTESDILIRYIEDCLNGEPEPADWALINDGQTRAVLQAISQHFDEQADPLQILDIGCGNLRLLNAMSSTLPDRRWSYVGVDVSPPVALAVRLNEGQAARVVALADYTPTASADIVVVQNVTHELSVWETVDLLSTVKRSLRPTGVLVFTDLAFLPFGEPRFVPLIAAELDVLFEGAESRDFSTKSGVPVLFRVVERQQIPFPYFAANYLRSALHKKRSAFAHLARKLEAGQSGAADIGLAKSPVFDYVYLSLLAGNATSRLSEPEPVRVTQGDALDLICLLHDAVYELAAFGTNHFDQLLERLHELAGWDYRNLYAAIEWFESRSLVFPVRVAAQWLPTQCYNVVDDEGGFNMIRQRRGEEFTRLHTDALAVTGGASWLATPWIT